jgi:hypothetical protein
MEAVLFDLYIAETEIKENSPVFQSDSIRKQQLLQSVFDKHRISQQTLDTSLVWYNAHLDKYLKINTAISARYDRLLTALTAEQERIRIESTVTDTTFFYASDAFWLRPAERDNIHAFFCDSNAVKAKSPRYDLALTALGIRDSISPVLTFCMQCQDTVFIHRDTIRQNGPFTAQYSLPGNQRIKSVYGNIHLPDSAARPALVTRFTVSQQTTTFHPKEEMGEKKLKLNLNLK